MRRALGTLVALCGVADVTGVASAGPARKVEIVTDPPGATIYLGDLDSGVACQPTPCTVEAPAGKKTSIIARMDGYAEEFGVIDLRKGSVKRVALTLTATTATLVVEDPGFAGGDVLVDDVKKGKAPTRISIRPEGHHVVVVANGKTLFDDFINPSVQEEFTIKPKPGAVAQTSPLVAGTTAPDEGTETPDNLTKSVDVGAAAPPYEPIVAVGVLFEVGFRQFRYSNPNNLPPTEDESGQVLIGPAVQFWPARAFHAHHLRGLSLYVKFGYGVNHQPVLQGTDNMPTGASTYWSDLELDVQHRWNFGEHGAVEIGGGYMRDVFEYQNAKTSTNLPYVSYQGMRLGVRGSLRFGAIEPYVQVEGRIPFSEGYLAGQFAKASATGGGAEAGLAMSFGHVVAKLEASIIYYSWSITNFETPTTSADGARDVIEGITAVLGGAF